ncbi:MAG: TonB-dependent receptor, partial [Planctomycetota bacterium]
MPRGVSAEPPEHAPEAELWLVSGEEEPSPFVVEDAPAGPEEEPAARPNGMTNWMIKGRLSPFPATPLAEGTVLTPGRMATLASEVGGSLSVITEGQITDRRRAEVTEVLRGTPGLDVAQQGGPGTLTSVFLRGANSNHTKVLVDGIPVNDPGSANGGFDFSLLSVDNIERIEILRGPQSTLYGTDAIGGVINVITKRGDGPLSLGADLSGGSYGQGREAVTASGGTENYHYSFGASYLQRDGFTVAAKRLGN